MAVTTLENIYVKMWIFNRFFPYMDTCTQDTGNGILLYIVKKRLAVFPSPDEMSLTKLSLDGNNEFIPLASVLDVSPYTKPAIL
jgi:hypothetical protein